jgi:hypothetical protein
MYERCRTVTLQVSTFYVQCKHLLPPRELREVLYIRKWRIFSTHRPIPHVLHPAPQQRGLSHYGGDVPRRDVVEIGSFWWDHLKPLSRLNVGRHSDEVRGAWNLNRNTEWISYEYNMYTKISKTGRFASFAASNGLLRDLAGQIRDKMMLDTLHVPLYSFQRTVPFSELDGRYLLKV